MGGWKAVLVLVHAGRHDGGTGRAGEMVSGYRHHDAIAGALEVGAGRSTNDGCAAANSGHDADNTIKRRVLSARFPPVQSKPGPNRFGFDVSFLPPAVPGFAIVPGGR
jgi:hypothetical protein